MEEHQKELELARSKVRRRLTYGAGILFAILILWGLMWMNDRSIAMVGINTCVAVIMYWFGSRNSAKEK